MSSKKAMKLAQKQAYAKHRSNITNSRFGSKKINFTSKVNKKSKKSIIQRKSKKRQIKKINIKKICKDLSQ